MSCRVTVLLQTDVYTRQTNSATPSNDREPQHDASKAITDNASMGVSCGAAAISIYNCGRQSDGQLCVKVRGHASSSSPSCDLSWLPSPGSPPALSWVAVRMDAPPQYRLQQQRDECLVLSYCDSPNYLVSPRALSVWNNRLTFRLQRNSMSYWINCHCDTQVTDTAQVHQSWSQELDIFGFAQNYS